MTDGPDIVFLGPSLRRAEAEQIHPDAIFLPPAAAGDVISAAARYEPHAIALIDGAFLQNLATYHKELLDVLSRGIWVVGASSMGALRAAECDVYGMIGVGEVYEGYASGVIEDDDEVALSHLAEEYGFRPVSEAMVNIRATLSAAVAEGVLSQGEAQTLIDCQKARWFPERRPLASLTDATEELGIDGDRLAALSDLLRNGWVDVKAADARLALTRLKELPRGPMPEATRPEMVPSGPYGVLVEHDMTVGDADGLPVTRDQIWRHFVLTDTRAPELVRNALLRANLAEFMAEAGVPISDADLLRARQAIAADLGVAVEDLESRARELDIRPPSLAGWIEEEAYVLRADEWRRYQRMSIGALESCLRQLARSGEYESVRRTAGMMDSLARSSGHLGTTTLGLATAVRVQRQISSAPLPEDVAELDRFIEFAGLGNRAELYERLITLIAGHWELFGLDPIEIVPAQEELAHDLEPQTSRGR
ncbi:MAG: TfuA-like protein [Candidatus Nanopelagicales bacterium]